jgi:hypothetical protein
MVAAWFVCGQGLAGVDMDVIDCVVGGWGWGFPMVWAAAWLGYLTLSTEHVGGCGVTVATL